MARPQPSDPRILVADDDRDVLGLISARLRRADYDVITASNGDEALALALRERPEVAILDIRMPGRNGLEVARALRADADGEDIQVIFLSARSEHHDIVRGFEAGGDDYVTKPFNGPDLDAHVKGALERLSRLTGIDAAALGKASRQPQVQLQMQALLVAAVGERQGELRGHVEAVAHLAVPVARRLGMDDGDLQTLLLAAHLHDVGKLGVPESVLDKPGPLDEDEWRLMRKHTLIGERILRAAPAMTQVASIVRSCHERWDGAGYPDGLGGDQIPLAARIIFVCDAFNAMVSARVYSKPRSRREALVELADNAGTAFDPSVVAAFQSHAAAAGWGF